MSSSASSLSNSSSTSSQLDVDPTALSSARSGVSLNDTSPNELPMSGFASFVAFVSGLERSLHTEEDPMLLDIDFEFSPVQTIITSSATCFVEKAGWKYSSFKGKHKGRWGKFIALKYTCHDTDAARTTVSWKQLITEVRVLLHEPVRYHPNIVRLLGISWGAVDDMQSNFPALVFEYSDLGTLAQFQSNSIGALSFDVKKKLCWDVAKGISILHACSVIHGDLKHENVLIYPNRDPDASVKYVAKLYEFRGSLMDIVADNSRSLSTSAGPWSAPELYSNTVVPEGMLTLTDVYAFGLLVWRTIMNGQNPYQLPQSNAEPMSDSQIFELKRSNELLAIAKEGILHCESSPNSVEILHCVFEHTIQSDPSARNLVRAIAALQVNNASEMEDLLQKRDKKNEEYNEYFANKVPGTHGVTLDSLGVYLAASNATTGDYDYQSAGRGFRAIRPPPLGKFVFEPSRLKTVLDWERQAIILCELEAVASVEPKSSNKPSAPTQINSAIAAFYAFQCQCYEFGTKLSSAKACHWLKLAASREECEEANLARAWCWRFHITYNVLLDVDPLKLLDWIRWSIINGHRKCITESESLVQLMIPGSESRSFWEQAFINARDILFTGSGGVGMSFFLPLALRRTYHMDDMQALQRDIQEELTFRGVQSIDEIYVNSRGDGLLHMAAGLGRPDTLKYLVETYHPTINKSNTSRQETPLISACRGGHLACALYLLDLGAAPGGDVHSLERPLWWLSSFRPHEIPIIAARLVQAGESLTSPRYPSFASVRGDLRKKYVLSDYENFLLLPASPLSRAVMMESLPAVIALLALGADPLEGLRENLNPETGCSVCSVVVAAVLTLPDILKALLDHIDAGPDKQVRLFSEIEMLEMALDCRVTIGDPTSVDRRASRLGPMYKVALASTLRMLHEREKLFKEGDNEAKTVSAARASAIVLSRLASLGRFNIIRNLLELGHSAKGYADVFPIVSAVEENRRSIFRLFVDHGADPLAVYDFPSQKRKRTLLQVVAERPRHARAGIDIAQALLEKGVPVNFVFSDDSIISRPAFASAVRRQDFELADLCLKYGANLDLAYVHQAKSPKSTVFGEMARYPTERNLVSLEYLLRQEKLPSFTVAPSTGETVLHRLLLFWATTHQQRRILERMVRRVLKNDIHISDNILKKEAVGIPFDVALSGNIEVFRALLDCVPSLSQNPILYFEYGGMKLVMLLRAIIAKFPQLPERISVMNTMLDIVSNRNMEMELMERYRLVLYRLEAIQ
ncbi:hypothetical protein C8R41DRAFT_854369 [Lentinula lateritia]|uniref:Protein kinase domain-containing protein n=1 Tax=Lentinula lateritia TaxID=40482 RepID=A0ABQ8V0T2_9AGAR|nr:hypothetical protein C8R41DRAFT_854369 [Lentinula lateritia]